MDSSLVFLGLIKKAGKLTVGEDSCGMEARAKKAKAILTASDASQNSVTRAGYYAGDAGCPHIPLPYPKAELGGIIGRGAPGMLAITDIGFAAAFAEKLLSDHPGEYGEAAAALRHGADRAAQRRAEKKRHEKNLRRGRKK